MQIECEVRTENQRLARNPISQPPQDALDSGPQLRIVIRLGDVVLGHFVDQLRLAVCCVDGGQDDDRQVRVGLDLAGQRQPVDLGHHQIQQDQVRPAGLQPAQRLLPVAGSRHFIAVVVQLLRQNHEQARVVVDQKNPSRPVLVHLAASLPRGPDGAGVAPSIGADPEPESSPTLYGLIGPAPYSASGVK